jgi:uncharacterized protein (TIGR00251 family)
MKYKITVKPNARKNEIMRGNDGMFVIRVTVPPIEGKANEKVIEILAEYFNKPKRSISIISGIKGRNKIIEVE